MSLVETQVIVNRRGVTSMRCLLLVSILGLSVITLISQTVFNTRLMFNTTLGAGSVSFANYFHQHTDDNGPFDMTSSRSRKEYNIYRFDIDNNSHNNDIFFSGIFEPYQCEPIPSLLLDRSLFPKQDGCLLEEQIYIGDFRPYCRFHNLTFNPKYIESVRLGGEDLQTVMGQKEKDEDVTYRKGALILSGKAIIPKEGENSYHYLNPVFNSSIVVINDSGKDRVICNESNTIKGITIFIQRYEYVNLFHTMADLWNVWTIYRRYRSKHINGIVFLDAHPAGNLDDVWTTLFGRYDRIRTFLTDKTCFEQVLFAPAGYTSHLNSDDCNDKDVGDAFATFVLTKYDLLNVTKVPGRVVIIDRKSYIAHPRSSTGQEVERIIYNLPELAEWIRKEVPQINNNSNDDNIQILKLHEMAFYEQLKAIRQAEFLIGRHGAGLTHVLFLNKDAHVIEIGSDQPHFSILSKWRNRIIYHRTFFEDKDYVDKDTFYSDILPIFKIVYDFE